MTVSFRKVIFTFADMERKEIINWAKSNLVNNQAAVIRTELNNHISLSNSGIKEAINQPHNHYYRRIGQLKIF